MELDRGGSEGGISLPKPASRHRQAARTSPFVARGSVWPCRFIHFRAPCPAWINVGPRLRRRTETSQPSVAASSIVTDQPNEPRVSHTAGASAIGRQVRCSAGRRQSRARGSALPTISSEGNTSGLHGGQLDIEAADQGRGGVRAGEAGIAQGHAGEPRRRGGCRGRFQPGHGILHLREGMQQWVPVDFAGRHAARRRLRARSDRCLGLQS
jgi:hypothetical protein